MTATSGKAASPLFDPPHLISDVLRYGTALGLVTATFCGIALALGPMPVPPDASEADSALLLDLPPAETSQAAAEAQDAATAAAARPRVEDEPTPPDVPTPEPATQSKDAPPPAAAPAAPLEKAAEPPKPVTAPPPAPAQAPQAPAEAGVRAAIDDSAGDEGTPHASAHQITLWQKALMRRLEAAKRSHHRAIVAAGTVKVAFEIDRHGTVRTARVAASSGSPMLDGAALALVRDASPFPAPPAGAGEKDMSFIVPIRFKR